MMYMYGVCTYTNVKYIHECAQAYMYRHTHICTHASEFANLHTCTVCMYAPTYYCSHTNEHTCTHTYSRTRVSSARPQLYTLLQTAPATFDCNALNPCTAANRLKGIYLFASNLSKYHFISCGSANFQCWVLPCAAGSAWSDASGRCGWP